MWFLLPLWNGLRNSKFRVGRWMMNLLHYRTPFHLYSSINMFNLLSCKHSKIKMKVSYISHLCNCVVPICLDYECFQISSDIAILSHTRFSIHQEPDISHQSSTHGSWIQKLFVEIIGIVWNWILDRTRAQQNITSSDPKQLIIEYKHIW